MIINHVPAEFSLEERRKYKEHLEKLEQGDLTTLIYLFESLGNSHSSSGRLDIIGNYYYLGKVLIGAVAKTQEELNALRKKCSILEQELKKHTGIEW